MDYAELQRANRNLRMVSRCQKALLRARTPEELSAAVCRAIAEEGPYSLAWTGTAVAAAGATLLGSEMHGCAEGRAAAVAAGWQYGGDCGSAIALEAMSDGAPCLRHGSPAEFGFPSALGLPLRTAEAGSPPEGVLCVYSSEEWAFDRDEVLLLQRIADDFAYTLEGMRAARKRRAAEQVLAYQANHDSTTGLANRTLFNDRLRQAMMGAERTGRKVAVLALTMDGYRGVKSSLGHEACNALLVHGASAMLSCLRDGDTVARLLGNEFAVIVSDLADEEDVMPVVARLLESVKQPLRWQDRVVATTVSIGVALAGKDGSDAASLLRSANDAMAHAVGLGGNRMRFHAHDMNERASRISAMEAELRRALARGELVLYYQPRAAMGDASLSAVEALVRWQHPSRGLIAPTEFLSLAESSGLIVPLAAWVIREVCRQQRAWREEGWQLVPVAINLSARQFREEGLAEHTEVALQMNDLSPSLLAFEVPEAAVMANVDAAIARLDELKSIGVGLSLDGLCTGQSSLARLRELPLNCLKISQSFVRKLGMERADEAICRSIIDIGHSTGLRIVAEGVETLQQREWLRAQHCDEIQGYFYARPMPADAFAKLLAADPPRSNTMLPLWKAINYKG